MGVVAPEDVLQLRAGEALHLRPLDLLLLASPATTVVDTVTWHVSAPVHPGSSHVEATAAEAAAEAVAEVCTWEQGHLSPLRPIQRTTSLQGQRARIHQHHQEYRPVEAAQRRRRETEDLLGEASGARPFRRTFCTASSGISCSGCVQPQHDDGPRTCSGTGPSPNG